MSYGPVKVFSGTIVSGASTLTSIDLAKSWNRIYVETPGTAAALDVYTSGDGSVFRQVFERVNTAPVQYQSLVVATNVSGGFAPIDVPGQYVQFRASATVANGAAIKIHCWD